MKTNIDNSKKDGPIKINSNLKCKIRRFESVNFGLNSFGSRPINLFLVLMMCAWMQNMYCPTLDLADIPKEDNSLMELENTEFESLRIDFERGVINLTIDHPPLNILDAVLITDLHNFAVAVENIEEVKVIVFQSADPDFFIPHGDMNFVNNPESFTDLSKLFDDGTGLNPMQSLHEELRKLPQITIAKIQGMARGGGAELISSLDMRFGAIGKMGLAQMEAPTGIIPGGGGTVYLPQLIGRARSLEVILGAELVDAKLAQRYGWINRALPEKELDGYVNQLALRIAKLSPGVIGATQNAIDASLNKRTSGLKEENLILKQLFSLPAATRLTRKALKAGAQTRAGEKNLEKILHDINN